MRRLLLTLIVLGLTGCAVRTEGVLLAQPAPSRCNLALSSRAGATALAEAWATRSDWPFVETGLPIDDVTVYSTITYDEQFQYDRSGGLYRGAQAVRTGVFVR